ncbi:hypothetical protein AVEN_213636-1 [Araneus ventricosus]|uniref:Uncharacterized protein n=1 Tax=Araneus ventricosus TaxID=182803 RepID=A0A4Y2W824_ARAVE|nr:hypothetical protein AVEN_213636-1 [Araneus ventricosus]
MYVGLVKVKSDVVEQTSSRGPRWPFRDKVSRFEFQVRNPIPMKISRVLGLLYVKSSVVCRTSFRWYGAYNPFRTSLPNWIKALSGKEAYKQSVLE